MATAVHEKGRIALVVSKHEAEVLRAMTGHLSFASPGSEEASAVFHALKKAGVQRCYDVNVEHTPTGSFHLVEV